MNTEHLAIASVPFQKWSGHYTKEEALKRGTMFPELDKPFFAELQMEGCVCGHPEGQGQECRELLMLEISQISFLLDDIVLYLDTHPQEIKAQEMRQELIETRKKLLKEFDNSFYPLTKDCAGLWTEGPMPWEGACI